MKKRRTAETRGDQLLGDTEGNDINLRLSESSQAGNPTEEDEYEYEVGRPLLRPP